MKPLDIATCVYILSHKRWGRTAYKGMLKSEKWWRFQLDNLINAPDIIIPPEHLHNGKPAEPAPVPFEIEMNFPNLDYATLLKAWKKLPHQPDRE